MRARRAILAGVAAWLVHAAPAPAHPPAPRLVVLPEPRPTAAPDGEPGLALDLGGATLVDVAGRQTVTVAGREVGRWTVPGADPSHTLLGFRAGDEVVVGKRLATSNGIGIESWLVLAFRLAGAAPVAPPLRFVARDWGPTAVRLDGRGLAVLATDWVWPTRGRSLHFVGAWFGVEAGELVPRGGWLGRPYSYKFERERHATPAAARPARWLRAGKARAYPAGPRFPAEYVPARPGGVQASP